MSNTIHIQLMDTFAMYVNGNKVEQLLEKSRKGVALMQFLILRKGQNVPTYRLMETLWAESESTNPESALKTLVSRMRGMLNQVAPDLGKCIVADHGAYRWESGEDVIIDLYELENLLADSKHLNGTDEERIKVYEQILHLYKGDLLQHSEQAGWVVARGTALHNSFLAAMYAYVDLLKRQERHDEVAGVCRRALDIDNFDDRLHMDLMAALIKTDRNNEAMVQYKHVMHLYYNVLGVRPGDDMQEFYKQIVSCGKTLEFNLEAIRDELRERNESRGAFICEYVVFKEIFNLQMRNLERLGSTMFLGVIMVSTLDGRAMEPMKQDNMVQGLLEILKTNLRKGDTVAHFNPTIVALLLPMVNYNTGHIVMERIKKIFYRKYPNSNVAFNYRIGPLSSDMKEGDPLQSIGSGDV